MSYKTSKARRSKGDVGRRSLDIALASVVRHPPHRLPWKGGTAMAESAIPYGRRTQQAPAVAEMHILWITAGLGCDGDSIAITAATQPSLEDLVLGAIPGLPSPPAPPGAGVRERGRVPGVLVPRRRGPARPVPAGGGRLDPQRARPETRATGPRSGVDRATGQPITTCEWIDRLAPKAWGVVAAGTCAAYGGIHAMEGNPTGCMGLPDYLGWGWRSKDGPPDRLRAGLPGAAGQLHGSAALPAQSGGGAGTDDPPGRGPAAHLAVRPDRPRRLRSGGLLRAGRLRQDYGTRECIVKLGCWGPVVQCNVGKRGWMAGIGGCPNVGGVCIGCTMPGFPDKFMPFLEMPPGAQLSTTAVAMYGKAIRALRQFTRASMNREPEWRGPGVDDDGPPLERHAQGRAGHDRLRGTGAMTAPGQPTIQRGRPSRLIWSRCRGTRSPGSSAASASTPRSTSPTGESPSATAPRRSSAATASS